MSHNPAKHEELIKQCLRSILDISASFLLKVQEAYKTYMKKIAKYLGGGADSDEQMMEVYEFETKLAMVC